MAFHYSSFSTKEYYNKAIKHFRSAKSIVVSHGKENISDVVNQLLDQGSVVKEQVPAFLNAVYLDKYEYKSFSFNLKKDSTFKPIALSNYFNKKSDADLVCLHYDSDGLSHIFNPKLEKDLDRIGTMSRHDLLVVYSHSEKGGEYQIAKTLYDALIGKLVLPVPIDQTRKQISETLLNDKGVSDVKPTRDLHENAPPFAPHKSNAKLGVETVGIHSENQTIRGSKSPMIGVVVTNELFHNGNIEAWKKIIQSYEHHFPKSSVNIYYDGEKVTNLNTLFQWGKVKNGVSLMFDVEGEKVEKVAKLKKYLSEGASPRFEAFLKGAPHQILHLF